MRRAVPQGLVVHYVASSPRRQRRHRGFRTDQVRRARTHDGVDIVEVLPRTTLRTLVKRRPPAPQRGGRIPSLGPQGLLETLRTLDEGVRVLELFDFLPPVRKCYDKFVIVTVRLTTDFVK